jgi:hypothetical protein
MEMCDERFVVHAHVTLTGVGRYRSRSQLSSSLGNYKMRVSYAISRHH